MGELRWVWLHPTGWTLAILGATLFLLTLAIPIPASLKRTLTWVFAGTALIGAIALGVYFTLNAEVGIYNEL